MGRNCNDVKLMAVSGCINVGPGHLNVMMQLGRGVISGGVLINSLVAVKLLVN